MSNLIDLDSVNLCRKVMPNRSKYSRLAAKLCHRLKGHEGRCEEMPFIKHLRLTNNRVAEKIKRDATMTTGASWKSKEAGPNRINRWVMLESDEVLKDYEIDMSLLQPHVVAKLREKAANYDSCILVAISLTFSVYGMPLAPSPPVETKAYLESLLGPITPNSTTCTVCGLPLSFLLFAEARRGKAAIETCHKDPRIHDPSNVGFAHRECNIAQGARTLDEFYDWISEILARVR